MKQSIFQTEHRTRTQNWAESAVFYNAPCDETESYRMSESEFLSTKRALETRLVLAYSRLYEKLNEGQDADLLRTAQKAWLDCYYAYIAALEQKWNEPVKIHFGVTGHERRTNVLREMNLLLLINRITDLEEWAAGRWVTIGRGEKSEIPGDVTQEAAGSLSRGDLEQFLQDKESELKEKRRKLQVDMGLCLYVISEEYRLKMMDAHQAFFRFYDRNREFVEAMSAEHGTVIGECLLQLDRMSYMTGVHYEGCRFFRREREE